MTILFLSLLFRTDPFYVYELCILYKINSNRLPYFNYIEYYEKEAAQLHF